MLRVVIVDDELGSIRAMQRLLDAHDEVQLVGTAQQPQEAAELIASAHPDVVFLDVELRGASGFDILGALPAQPVVVFVTAHSRYAVQAFSVEAADYLVKPVRPERLAETLRRIERLLSSRLAAPAPGGLVPGSPAIELRMPSRTILAQPDEIVALVAEGDFARVLLADQPTLLILRTLSQFEKLLPTPPFQRLDRSTILNAGKVRRIVTKDRNLSLVTLDGLDDPMPLGRTAVSRLRSALATIPVASRDPRLA
jgi:two-component system LytT family response regulator